MSNQKRGNIIVVTGGEGAGKSTTIASLKEKYPEHVYTREPGGTPYAEDIRTLIFKGKDAIPLTLLLLFFAARAEHILKLILPALLAGKTVFCDRFAESTYAYQVMENPELEEIFWMLMEKVVFNNLGITVRYVFLDVDPEVGLARVKSRGGEITYFDTKPLSYHIAVRSGIQNFFEQMHIRTGHIVAHTINANQSEDQVFAEVLAYLEQLDY